MLNAQVQVQTILYPKVSGVKRPVGCQGSSTILSLVAITFHLRHRLKGIFSVALHARTLAALAMDPTLALNIGVVTMCHCDWCLSAALEAQMQVRIERSPAGTVLIG